MNLYLRKKINWLISLLILMFSQMSYNFNLIFLLYIIILICDLYIHTWDLHPRDQKSHWIIHALRIVFVLIHICSDVLICSHLWKINNNKCIFVFIHSFRLWLDDKKIIFWWFLSPICAFLKYRIQLLPYFCVKMSNRTGSQKYDSEISETPASHLKWTI